MSCDRLPVSDSASRVEMKSGSEALGRKTGKRSADLGSGVGFDFAPPRF